MPRTAHADHTLTGQVKITRADGRVEYQDIPADGIEMYDVDGVLSSTYPAGFGPGEPVLSVRRWWRIAAGAAALAALAYATRNMSWLLGAIVWTDAGQAQAIDVLDPGTRGAQVTVAYGAWGSGATAPAVAQTALVSENAEARVLTTISQPAANTIQWLWEVTASGNRTVNEAGVFTATTAGIMQIRLTLSTLNIETGDRVEWTVQLLVKDVSE